MFYVKLRCKNAILRVSDKEAGKNIPENMKLHNSLGIDIGSTTVKIAVLTIYYLPTTSVTTPIFRRRSLFYCLGQKKNWEK